MLPGAFYNQELKQQNMKLAGEFFLKVDLFILREKACAPPVTDPVFNPSNFFPCLFLFVSHLRKFL